MSTEGDIIYLTEVAGYVDGASASFEFDARLVAVRLLLAL